MLFEYELAERLHMTVAELRHGRGAPMSLQELTVGWPLYTDYKNRQIQAANEDARHRV